MPDGELLGKGVVGVTVGCVDDLGESEQGGEALGLELFFFGDPYWVVVGIGDVKAEGSDVRVGGYAVEPGVAAREDGVVVFVVRDAVVSEK